MARSGRQVLYVVVEGVVSIAAQQQGRSSARPDRAQRFTSFCTDVEPRLRRALVAAYGVDLGYEATAEALGWAWEHFDRVETMGNPAGYLWRVGQTAVRRETRHRRWRPGGAEPSTASVEHDVEPALLSAMASLTPRQRAAVLLVHGHEHSLAEAAEQMDCRVRTLRNHLDRGLRKLRRRLGVADDA